MLSACSRFAARARGLPLAISDSALSSSTPSLTIRCVQAQEKALTIRCVQVQEKALAPPRRAPQQEPPRSHSSLGFQPRARRASVAGPPGSALLRGWHDPCALGRWEAARLSPGLDCWESACGGASGAREGLPSALFSAAAIQPCEPGAAGEGARRVRARRASVCAAELSGRCAPAQGPGQLCA